MNKAWRVIDAHSDVLSRRAFEPEQVPCVTLDHLRGGGVAVLVAALFTGHQDRAGTPYGRAQRQLQELQKMRAEGLRLVDDPADLLEETPSVLVSIEGCDVFEGKLQNIEFFRKAGARLAAITWNYENEMAYPASSGSDQGIKPFGWEALGEMARLGMAADVSHLNERGFWDLIERYEKPPLATHSDCRALCDHPRNLTDDQIRGLCGRGGWMGINFLPLFLTGGAADIGDIVRHIDHVAQMGYIRHVGFGSDFDGIDELPEGVRGPQDFPAILAALRDRGYDERTLQGIAGGHFLEYFQRFTSA